MILVSHAPLSGMLLVSHEQHPAATNAHKHHMMLQPLIAKHALHIRELQQNSMLYPIVY